MNELPQDFLGSFINILECSSRIYIFNCSLGCSNTEQVLGLRAGVIKAQKQLLGSFTEELVFKLSFKR